MEPAMEPAMEPEYQETSKEMRFATAIGVSVAAFDVSGSLLGLSSMAAFDWIIVWRAVTYGLAFGGTSYALALIVLAIAPNLPSLLLKEVEEATGKDLGKSSLPIGQPVRERLQVEPLELADNAPLLPPWVLAVDKLIYPDGRVFANNHLVDPPDGFNTDWLYSLAEARYTGKLPDVSQRTLDAVGISRFGNGNSPASLMIEL